MEESHLAGGCRKSFENFGPDKLFHLDMSVNGQVRFESLDFQMRGTVDSWLSSHIFEIQHPGSTEREAAIREALRVQSLPSPTKEEVQATTDRLKEHLSTEDPFWIRWIFFADSYGVSL